MTRDRAGDVTLLASPVEDEDPLLAELGEPCSDAGATRAASSSEANRPEESMSFSLTSSATASTSPEPQMPVGSASPMTPSSRLGGGHLHDLDRPGRGSHAAADRRSLEGRAGRRGRRDEGDHSCRPPARSSCRHPRTTAARITVHPRGAKTGDNVAAHVAPTEGKHRPSSLVHFHAELSGEDLGEGPRRQDERGHPQWSRVDAEHEMGHRRVPGHGDLVDLRRIDATCLADRRPPARRGVSRASRQSLSSARRRS